MYKRKRGPARGFGRPETSAAVYVPRTRRRRRAPRVFTPFRGRYAKRFEGELKFHDVDLDDATITTAGAVTDSINLIPQGVTEITRVGRKCTITRINWHFNIILPEVDDITDPSPGDIVRVIMYLDKQANGAAATALGILETDDYQSFNNLANSGRFRILMDRNYSIQYASLASATAGNVSSAAAYIQDSFYKKCNIPLEFDSTTGAVTEIRSNNLGVMLITREGAAGFFSKIRLRFHDG